MLVKRRRAHPRDNSQLIDAQCFREVSVQKGAGPDYPFDV